MAIANHCPLAINSGLVRFCRRDYGHGGKRREMTLLAAEFIRRFLLQALPPQFRKIRNFGFLVAWHQCQRLPLCRQLLGMPAPGTPAPNYLDRFRQLTRPSPQECLACGAEAMLRVAAFEPGEVPPPLEDTS